MGVDSHKVIGAIKLTLEKYLTPKSRVGKTLVVSTRNNVYFLLYWLSDTRIGITYYTSFL